MNNKNIAIFNMWWSTHNYGAMLTAYALQAVIKNLNYSSILNKNISQFYEKKSKLKFYKAFRKRYLYFEELSDEDLNNNFNTFITGSDQVFRPIYIYEKMEQYLLDFAKHNSKKIALSASFGVDKKQFLKENSSEVIEKMKKSLKSFDYISVRENSGVEICRDVLGVDAEWIIDPVFIYNDWNTLLNNSTYNYENKIVSYVLDTEKKYQKAFKYLEKQYNAKVIETANSNISIENWLKSIKDCELFVTDSFHGMCFAIIFNKPFICIANKSRGRARFDSICEMLNIENQCLDSINEIYEKDCVFKVDYEEVNNKIEYERQRGLKFLKKSLDASIKITQEKIDSRIIYLRNRVLELESQCNLKMQFKKSVWNLWLNIFYRLPSFVRKIIQLLRGKK